MLNSDDMVWIRELAQQVDREFAGKNLTPAIASAINDRIHIAFEQRFAGVYIPKIEFGRDGTMTFGLENPHGRGDLKPDPAERDRILGLEPLKTPNPAMTPKPTPVETRVIDGEVFVKAADVLTSLATWQLRAGLWNEEATGYWWAIGDVRAYMLKRIERAGK